MRGLNMMRRWKTKRRIKKIEKEFDLPSKINVWISNWEGLKTEDLDEIARYIAKEILFIRKNLENELESLKQSLHR